MTANEELRPGLLGLESSTGFQSLNTIIGRQTHNQLILHMHFIGPFVYKHCWIHFFFPDSHIDFRLDPIPQSPARR